MKSSIVTAQPGHKIRLRDIDTSAKGEFDAKEDSLPHLEKLREKLGQWQETLYAERKQSLLIIFQAMDTGGKDGAVKSVLTGVNPAGVQVTGFKAPSAEEIDHDFLWRLHHHAPPKGIIGVWNRSHYEDVLITRVHKMIDKKTCVSRYDDINDFEDLLASNGVTILKFYLMISKDEQKQRLQARLNDPTKQWKFNPGDLEERKLWDDYQKAYEDAINATSTKHAPWHIVPSDRNWARNIAIAEVVVAALEQMNPKFPEPTFDPKTIVVE